MSDTQERYLGDGVYASYDGYQIWLDLRGQDGTTRIALDSSTFKALLLFERNLHNAAKGESDATRQ